MPEDMLCLLEQIKILQEDDTNIAADQVLVKGESDSVVNVDIANALKHMKLDLTAVGGCSAASDVRHPPFNCV